jgi:hypothetical protein
MPFVLPEVLVEDFKMLQAGVGLLKAKDRGNGLRAER